MPDASVRFKHLTPTTLDHHHQESASTGPRDTGSQFRTPNFLLPTPYSLLPGREAAVSGATR